MVHARKSCDACIIRSPGKRERIMTLKDVLVAFDDTPASLSALDYALSLASERDAALTGAYVYPPAKYHETMQKWLRPDVVQAMDTAERNVSDAVGAAFRERLELRGLRRQAEWIVEGGEPGPTLARIGRFHDLTVVGQFVRSIARERGALEPEELIRRAARPLIVVPRDYEREAAPHDKRDVAVVAWDGSRGSARALSDALQILEPRPRLDIVTVETGRPRDLYAPMPERDIAVHLSRHGVEARVVNIEAPIDRVGHAILDHCSVVHPEMLIIGAYGRAKFGALRFGGVTAHILDNMFLPVLVSQ